MKTSDLIQEIYYAYRGKGASKTPLWGSEKANTALAIANRLQRIWAKDSNVKWFSLFRAEESLVYQPGTVAIAGTTAVTGTDTYFTDYKAGDKITIAGEERIIDTITSDTSLTVTVAFTPTTSGVRFTHKPIIATGVQEYSLHRNFYVPSDAAKVSTTNQDITLSTANAMQREDGDVYIYGKNPKKLAFYETIESTDQKVGGTLKVAGFYLPESLVLATDLVAVDDPDWLVYATAAELARNDAAKDDQYANLQGMANDLYRKMVDANNELGFLQANTVPMNMPPIGDQANDDWSV